MTKQITPETVAAMLAENDNDLHDGNGWWPSLTARGNIVEITVTPVSDEYEAEEEDEIQLRAVVVEGGQDPIVLPRPAEPGSILAADGKPLLTIERLGNLPPMIVMWPGGADENPMSPDNARELAAHLVALADQAEGGD